MRTQVGVYVGCCGSELHAQWLSDIKDITGYEQTGCTLSMFANRLSFFFDFKGPSKAVDTGARPRQLSRKLHPIIHSFVFAIAPAASLTGETCQLCSLPTIQALVHSRHVRPCQAALLLH